MKLLLTVSYPTVAVRLYEILADRYQMLIKLSRFFDGQTSIKKIKLKNEPELDEPQTR